jgi:hypothetical protein
MTSPVQVQFANTPIPETMLEMGFKVDQFKNRNIRKVADAFATYMQKTGSTEITADTQRKIAAYLDGLWDTNNPLNRLTKGLGGTKPLMKAPSEVMTAAELELGSSVRNTLNEIYSEMYEQSPDAKQAVIDVLKRKVEKSGKLGNYTTVTGAKRAVTQNLNSFPKAMQEEILSLQKAGKWSKVNQYGQIAKILDTHNQMGPSGFVTSQAKKTLTEALAQKGIEMPMDIARIEGYFPHVARITEQDYESYLKGLMGTTEGSRAKSAAMNVARTTNVLSTSAYKRMNQMLPDMADMQRLADIGVLDRSALASLQNGVGWDSTTKRFVGEQEFRQYSLRAEPVLAKYVNDSANQHVWTGLKYGEKIKAATKKLDPIGQRMMSDTYIPQMMGKLTDRQAFESLEWAATRDRWITQLSKGEGFAAYLPKDFRNSLTKRFMDYSGPVTWQGVSGKLAGYFYSTTLGGNVGSAVKNLLQTFLTLMPEVGVEATMTGMKEATGKIKSYIGLRNAGTAKDIAWGKVFGEYEQSGLAVTPLSSQLSRSYVEDAYDMAQRKTVGKVGLLTGSQGNKIKNVVGRTNELMMKAFQGTETWNRIVSFQAGIAKYTKDVPGAVKHGEGALRFARDTVLKTQFPAGPGQSPYAIANLNPLFRQFLHFPGRFLGNLLTSTIQPTVRDGKVAFAKGMNFGNIGRTLAISTVIYQLGKELFSTDLSSGLMTGALPLPQSEDSPFYPFPVVPPIVSLAGATAQSIMTGDMSSMKYALPTLVPGGVALSKVRGAFSPEVADYKNKLPDGRIPLYTSTGSLKGYKTSTQLFAKAMGVGNMDDVKEREMVEYLVKQKEVLRDYRRQYIEALYQNDTRTAENINLEFQKEMPGLGPLQVKASDIKALETRKTMTRLQRTLATMPVQYREEYAQMMSRTMGIETLNAMQGDPSMMQPVPITRGQGRPQQGGSQAPASLGSSQPNPTPYQFQMGQQNGMHQTIGNYSNMTGLPPINIR